MINLHDFVDILVNGKVVTTQEEYDVVSATNKKIIGLINRYIQKHGNIALACGSEWMYQDDTGQVDALALVGDILDALSILAENEEEWD